MKRVVVLELKDGTQDISVYSSSVKLVLANQQKIGIGLGALWNALSKTNGNFENKKCRIYYKYIDK